MNYIKSMPYLDQHFREKLIFDIQKKYDFISIEVLGKSYCKRDIFSMKIGNQNNACLLVGGIHGMEWLTSLLLLIFIDKICQAMRCNSKIYDMDLKNFLRKNGVCFVPCLNPDGTEISIHGSKCAKDYANTVEKISNGNTNIWQSNARGVDLNHNFDAKWEELNILEKKNGITGPAPTRFGGEFPESEIETQILVELCKENNYRHAIAFHSQGEEIYWNFGDKQPENSFLLAKLFSNLSGYKLSQPEGLAVGGGFKDWFIEKFNKPAFTIEIGKGKNPLPISDVPDIYSKLEKMLVFSIIF